MLMLEVEYSCVQRKVMFYTDIRFLFAKLSDSANVVILVQPLIAYSKQ